MGHFTETYREGLEKGKRLALAKQKRKRITSPLEVHIILGQHPNFVLPEPTQRVLNGEMKFVVDYVIETVSRYASPPKQDEENDEIACESLSEAIKFHLKPDIYKKLGISDD